MAANDEPVLVMPTVNRKDGYFVVSFDGKPIAAFSQEYCAALFIDAHQTMPAPSAIASTEDLSPPDVGEKISVVWYANEPNYEPQGEPRVIARFKNASRWYQRRFHTFF